MCRVLESSQVTKTFDDEQKVPYAYIGNEWYGYDDPESVGFKVSPTTYFPVSTLPTSSISDTCTPLTPPSRYSSSKSYNLS